MPPQRSEVEKFPSGKSVVRRYDNAGQLLEETHSYGILEIALQRTFEADGKSYECYFSKKRMVSRKTYTLRRTAYSDMPEPDCAAEDFSGSLNRELRAQGHQNKREASERLNRSVEAKFLRPKSTNWLRIVCGEKAHLVEFRSRDWKALGREMELKTGPEWLRVFGFHGPPQARPSIHLGPLVGYEIAGERMVMLEASHRLFDEVSEFAKKPPEPTTSLYSFAPVKRKRPAEPLIWLAVLPSLIEFLSDLDADTVAIFNHHQ